MSQDITYTPGSWVALSAPRCWLLVAVPADHDVVHRCWSLLSAGGGVDDVLDALVMTGIRAAPAFALAGAVDEARRVVVRGAATVTLTDASGNQEKVSSSGHTAWAEKEFGSDVTELQLDGEDAQAAVELPLPAGVTLAARLRVRLTAQAAAEQTDESPSSPAAEIPTTQAVSRAQSPSAAPPEVDAADAAPSYDHLFGATQRPEPAPEQPASGGEPEAAEQTAGWATLSPPPPDADQASDSSVTPSSPPAGLIDALPWAAPVPATPGPPVWQPPTPAEASQTVDRASLRSAATAAADGSAPAGPTVLAGYCPAGHLSPPHAAVCRVCRAAMPPGQDGFEISRPPLGVLRLSTGDVVTLDRGVLLGRAPEVPGGAGERPHAVRLASPQNDVSRTHAEVVLDGWHVYVRDLGSTNGTVVTLRGQAPQRLRPNDLQLLEPGAVVTLADEVSFTFEAAS